MKKNIIALLLSKNKKTEIVRVPMASILSWKFFECCNARYYFNIFSSPIELFTHVVIITLIILMISQLILWMVCI